MKPFQAMPIFLFALITAILLSGCSTQKLTRVEGECWEHSIKINESASNLILLCATGSTATSQIYFSNPDSTPTTCAQSGTTEWRAENIRAFSLQRGSCVNGRTLEMRNISCTTDHEGNLLCSAPDLPAPMKFTRSQLPSGDKIDQTNRSSPSAP